MMATDRHKYLPNEVRNNCNVQIGPALKILSTKSNVLFVSGRGVKFPTVFNLASSLPLTDA